MWVVVLVVLVGMGLVLAFSAAAKQGVLGTAATANVPAREANPNAIGGAAREARPCLLRSQDAQRLGRRLAHVPTASKRHVCATQVLRSRGAAAKRALS